MKYINFKRYKFSTIFKNINFNRFNFSKFYKYLDLRKYDYSKLYKYLDLRKYDFSKIYKYLSIKKYKHAPFYIASFIFLLFFIYISIPFFYNYEKSKFSNLICNNLNVKCLLKGKVSYSFFPSPRINLKNLEILDSKNNGKLMGQFDKVIIKLALTYLFNQEKFKPTAVQLENGELNLDYEKIKIYKNIFNKKNILQPIVIKKSKVNFFDKKEYITAIENINFKYKSSEDSEAAKLEGSFLNDKININFKNKKDGDNLSKFLTVKLSNLRISTKIEFTDSLSRKNMKTGNVVFKKNQNKITGTFDYKDGEMVIKQANLRNAFLDGKLSGVVKFLPFFSFNLDTNLNSINFNRLHSALVALKEEDKKNLFRVNKKINGKLNLTANKIFSKHTLIDSFESRIQFINGDIFFDQLLLNIKKLGAADIVGVIKNDKKFSNFKFENNIYLDNLKKLYNKFGIYNKPKLRFDLFISGNMDLVNLDLRLNEISTEAKFKEEDVSYIEKEFNDILLEDGYESLFNYSKLKEFIQQIILETN